MLKIKEDLIFKTNNLAKETENLRTHIIQNCDDKEILFHIKNPYEINKNKYPLKELIQREKIYA